MTTATGPPPSARPGIGRGRSLEDRENRLELAAQVLHRLGGERAPRLGFQLTRAAVLLDLLTRPFDRVFRGVQKTELALPVAQHVRLQIGELADLADREEFLDGVRDAHRPPPPPLHCSAFSSRSIRSATA